MDSNTGTGGRDAQRDDAAIRDLALRLLSQRFPPGHESEAIELVVGRLPEQMPVEIPIPGDSRIIGSVVYLESGHRGYGIILGSDMPAEQILDFYDENLEAAGWMQPDMGHMFGGHGGFTGNILNRFMGYWKGENGPKLTVNANPIADGSTEVQLRLSTRPEPSPDKVTREQIKQGLRFDFEQVIPVLKPPRRADQMPMGGGGGSGTWNSNAQVVAELEPSSLAAHYAEQLQQAGWIAAGEGSTGPLVWSAWNVKDKEGNDWIGLLFIIERAGDRPVGKRLYYLSIHAHKVSGDIGRGGSWSSSQFGS